MFIFFLSSWFLYFRFFLFLYWYRQVFLLKVAFKIFECCLLICLTGNLKQYSIKPNMVSKKITPALFISCFTENLNINQLIQVKIPTMWKTIDNIDHGILLTELFKLGVRGTIIKLLQYHSIGTKQGVRINGHFSKAEMIEVEFRSDFFWHLYSV